MDLKEKTKMELETRIKDLEKLIARKGVGSSYLNRMERIQRNLNLAIFSGILLTVVGLIGWLFFGGGSDDEES